jgi:glycerol transport system ATP-binding protein
MHEGRVTQYGPAGQVYRQPADLLTAQVYSEPPMNTLDVTKQGATLQAAGAFEFAAIGSLGSLPDGAYQLGIRAHHVTPVADAGSAGEAIIGGVVQVTEISGSESTTHFHFGDRSWVSQANGIHALDVGQTVNFALDLPRALVFDDSGRLVDRDGG